MGCSSSKNLTGVSSSTSSSTDQCVPQPVFVIKTTNEITDEKLFINVLVLEDSVITPSEVMIGDISTDVDKRSHECQIIDFVCSPLIVEYPSKGNSSVDFNPQFSKFCLWCIKLTRDTLVTRGILNDMDQLSSKYSTPRVLNSYKGKSICTYDESKVVPNVNFDGEASNSKHISEAIEGLRDQAITKRQSVEDAERKKQAIIASSARTLSKDTDKNGKEGNIGKRLVENVYNAAGDTTAMIEGDSSYSDLSDDDKEGKKSNTTPPPPSSFSPETEMTKAPPDRPSSSKATTDQLDTKGKAYTTSSTLQQDSKNTRDKNIREPLTSATKVASDQSDTKGKALFASDALHHDSKNTRNENINDSRTIFAKVNSMGSTSTINIQTPQQIAKINNVEEDASDDMGADPLDEINAIAINSNVDNDANKIKQYRTEGFGKKLARSAFVKNWKNRYFVLSSDKFEYFVDQSRLDKKGEFFIDEGTSIQSVEGSSTMFMLSSDASGAMKVDVPNSEERDEWIETINFHVSSLRLSHGAGSSYQRSES